LAVLGPRPAGAQNVTDVRAELNRTDVVLLKAKRLVIDQRCPSKLALELLVRARDIQKMSWEAYGKGLHRAALKGTRTAREKATDAIRIAERWQFVKNHIQKTAELLETAAGMVAIGQNPQAATLLETALSQFERGKEALRAGQVEQAYHLLKNANKLARNIISQLQEQGADRHRVVRELERTDRLIEKVQPFIEESGHETALTLLEHGIQTQVKAWDFFEKGQYRLAHDLTVQARELAAKAWVMVEGPISPQRVRAAIEATDDLMSRVRPVIMDSQNQSAIELFLSAGEHQDKAKAALAEDRLNIALAQTKIARRLVDRALKMVEEA
jgi:hypothetical protein